MNRVAGILSNISAKSTSLQARGDPRIRSSKKKYSHLHFHLHAPPFSGPSSVILRCCVALARGRTRRGPGHQAFPLRGPWPHRKPVPETHRDHTHAPPAHVALSYPPRWDRYSHWASSSVNITTPVTAQAPPNGTISSSDPHQSTSQRTWLR